MSSDARSTLIASLNPNESEASYSRENSMELVTCRMRGQDDSLLPPADQRIKKDLDTANEKLYGLNISQM